MNRANPRGSAHGPRPARRLIARRNRQKPTHGGIPPLDSSPSVTTAEDRPVRAPRTPEGWRVQAGLLARGSSSFSAFPGFDAQSPVATWGRTRRRQLRGQLRIWLATERPIAPDSLFGRSTRPAHL